jgi:ribosome-binding factor A
MFDELILREVSEELRQIFPDQIISVTQVHVSKDLAFAKIWVSSIHNIEDIVKTCNLEGKNMRKRLSERIVARKVPRLYFVSDLTEEKAQRIDELFNQLKS